MSPASPSRFCGRLPVWLFAALAVGSCPAVTVTAAQPPATDAAQSGQPRGVGTDASAATPGFDTVIEVTGTVVGARGKTLMVERADGEQVTVWLHEDPTRLRFIADAKPAYLRKGMMVRAEASLGPGAIPTGPVGKVEIFQAIPLAGLPHSAKEKFTPGIHPAKKGDARPQAGFVPGDYGVVGMVIGMDTAGIYLNTGQSPLPLPVGAETEFTLNVNNTSLVQPGDPVSIEGFHQPPDETQIKANSVVIRPERVFGDDEGLPNRRQTRRGSRRTPAAEQAYGRQLPNGRNPNAP